MKNQFLLGLALVLLSGCNGTPGAQTGDLAMHGDPVATLPTPYTAEQLYAACPSGTTITSRIQGPGHPTAILTTAFEQCSRDGYVVRSTMRDVAGNLLIDPSELHLTWEEMRRNAALPEARTTLQHKSRTGPLGTLPCKVYTVQSADHPDQSTVFWFAEELPGPPIFYADYSGDEIISSVEIIERR